MFEIKGLEFSIKGLSYKVWVLGSVRHGITKLGNYYLHVRHDMKLVCAFGSCDLGFRVGSKCRV